MPKYWGKQIFTHGRFPEVGQKQKTKREKKEGKLVITMASYNGTRKAAWANSVNIWLHYENNIYNIFVIQTRKL